MRDARAYCDGVDELGAMKRQAELDAMFNRIATGVFTGEDDLRYLIQPKRSGGPEGKG